VQGQLGRRHAAASMNERNHAQFGQADTVAPKIGS
jgi:hypothetical protein